MKRNTHRSDLNIAKIRADIFMGATTFLCLLHCGRVVPRLRCSNEMRVCDPLHETVEQPLSNTK